MKKLLNILLAILMLISVSACQKKISATISFTDEDSSAGGMQAQVTENDTVKDLFDQLGKGTDFTYELNEDGSIATIRGKANDENGHWEITINGEPITDNIGNIKLNEGDVCEVTYIANTANEVVGGWEIAEVAREELTDEEKTIIEKALEGLVGVGYEPVCVLATQVVNGTNYAYLARGTTVTLNPVSKFYIIKVYQSLEGEVELSSINEIDVTDIKTREDVDDFIVGGWEVKGSGKAGSLGSEEAQSSYDEAMADIVSVGYNPIQLLASQLVNGMNYIALVRDNAVSVDTTPELYIVSWHDDLNGKSTVSDIKKFDLNYYVEQ